MNFRFIPLQQKSLATILFSICFSLLGCMTDRAASEINCSKIALPCLDGTADVSLRTSKGLVVVRVDGDNAPLTAGNFIDLVRRGTYNQTIFHRVVKSPVPFVVQGGDPISADPKSPSNLYGTGNFVDPKSGEARYIPLEFKLKTTQKLIYGQELTPSGQNSKPVLTHDRGAVAMARSTDPNSASAQFYIALEALPELDGRYAVFGRVLRGMDVVDKLQQGDRIITAEVLGKE